MTHTGRATATVNGVTVAETTEWEEVEGNVYFPPGSLTRELFEGPTGHSTHCPWKGDAQYYNVKTGDRKLENAAWYYPDTKDKAKHFEGYVAFYKSKVDIKTE
ncbi:hypothetical protein HYQ45_004451 [Verticillium longisporum]|nr:hypothetical protein HYQ44_001334 [Verticillium longisporum]KAG7138475.1 hypothetical protein HYQ45_004451 [Verticillium longisporum]CRK35985.1 hypothetical protein BN1723_015038 [Verticillium longisporum]